MAYRAEERQYHTRFGWWLMSHDRVGSAVLGGPAIGFFIGDLIYLGVRWDGLQDAFDRSFLIGFGVLAVTALVSQALGLDRPVGPNRGIARFRARLEYLFAIAVIGVLVGLPVGRAHL